VTPAVADAAEWRGRLAGALGAGDIAAVLLALAPADERTMINRVKAMAPDIQDKGVALVLDNQPDIVARGSADGVHIAGTAQLEATIEAFKPDRIVGVGNLKTRHDAMLAGEAGADYVLFGEPDAAGRRPPFAAIVERVDWWAALFEVPCVGFAATLDEVAALAAAGADFVAVGDCVWNDPRGVSAAVAEAAERLALETAA
jgi:thiamine-phosphate pyrophosphorylase